MGIAKENNINEVIGVAVTIAPMLSCNNEV